MPIDERGMNSDYINYFSLEEYIRKIKLMPDLLEHLEFTSVEFDEYMQKLASYDEDYIINYWIYLLYEELDFNQKIEDQKFNWQRLTEKDIFFDKLSISHKRIFDVHNFVIGEDSVKPGYRHTEVRVSRINPDLSEDIFWRGVSASDVQKFMNDFIKVYRSTGTSMIYSSPFLFSALMHLLFVRIHPFTDGNGRTARVIHNIKFTESINKLYGTKLKLSPLNLSQSISLNRITYHKCLNNIYFDLEHNNTDSINRWFDFILDMADEQIYRATSRLEAIDSSHIIKPESSKDMGLKKLKNIKK